MLSSSAGAVIFRMDEISDKHPGPENVSPIMAPNNKGKRLRSAHWGPTQDELSAGPFRPADIFLTPLLSWNDGAAMTYFGHYDFFFIRETNMLKEVREQDCQLSLSHNGLMFVVARRSKLFCSQCPVRSSPRCSCARCCCERPRNGRLPHFRHETYPQSQSKQCPAPH